MAVIGGRARADDWSDCIDPNADISIRGCSALIAKGQSLKKAYNNRGYSYQAQGKHPLAISDFDRAIRLDPKYVQALENRGYSHSTLGHFSLAIADYTKAIALAPSAHNYFMRGVANGRAKDLDAEIADYNRALAINPNFPFAYYSRSAAYFLKRDNKAALADIRKYIELRPEDAKAQDWLRTVEGAAGRATTKAAVPDAGKPPTAIVQQAAPKVAAAPAIQATPGKRLALVIGNGAYRHSAALPNPANDARSMADLLRSIGFEVIEGIDADLETMNRLMRDYARKSQDADVTLLFYAGHGMQVGARNFLVPVDAELKDATSVDFELVDVQQSVVKYMGGGKRIGIVLLDACRDNPLSRSLARRFSTTRSGVVGEGLAEIRASGGTLVAFATAPGDVALDGEGKNSPFTVALLKHLRTPGMEIERVLKLVKRDVYETTGEKQEPWHNSSLRSDLVLVGN
ncbi:MAG: caspase family protein [Notoacmeibacter sp.]|nr:caspase family protein [Notoacmeibacter sp.]